MIKAKSINQHGIGTFSIILVILAAALVIFAGWRVYLVDKEPKSVDQVSTQSQLENTEPKKVSTVEDLVVLSRKYESKSSSDEGMPCDYLKQSYTNIKEVAKLTVKSSKKVVVCESYTSSSQNCFADNDKAEANPMPCADSSNGPWNMLYVFEDGSSSYTAVDLVLDNAKLPEDYRSQDGRWVIFGRRYASTIPNLSARQIGNSNFYSHSDADECASSLACSNGKKALYYKVSDDLILDARFYTTTELNARGG